MIDQGCKLRSIISNIDFRNFRPFSELESIFKLLSIQPGTVDCNISVFWRIDLMFIKDIVLFLLVRNSS